MSLKVIARRIGGAAGTGVLVLGGLFGAAAPASAEVNPNCWSVTQIGSTAYVYLDGQTAASVKQFKGCGKNWGYVYVWQSFRKSHSQVYACTDIETNADASVGRRCGYGYEFWSRGTDTLSVCTRAMGAVDIPGDGDVARTSWRC